MTVSYFALYRTPEDPGAFEQHYFGSHVPLIGKPPAHLENRVHRVTRQFVGEPAYHLVAELVFASPEAMREAFRSQEWRGAGARLAGGGGGPPAPICSGGALGGWSRVSPPALSPPSRSPPSRSRPGRPRPAPT